jgi:hypothetical protein
LSLERSISQGPRVFIRSKATCAAPPCEVRPRQRPFPLSSFQGSAEALPTNSIKAAAQIAVDDGTPIFSSNCISQADVALAAGGPQGRQDARPGIRREVADGRVGCAPPDDNVARRIHSPHFHSSKDRCRQRQRQAPMRLRISRCTRRFSFRSPSDEGRHSHASRAPPFRRTWKQDGIGGRFFAAPRSGFPNQTDHLRVCPSGLERGLRPCPEPGCCLPCSRWR